MTTHIYAWGNNEKRASMKGRRCRIIEAKGSMNSCLIEFENGQREIVSRRALRGRKMSKYLKFERHEVVPEISDVISKRQKQCLGTILYYPPWKQYVFEPISNTIFNDECLKDIFAEIAELNQLMRG